MAKRKKKRKKKDNQLKFFLELLEEAGDHRSDLLENIAGLIEAGAYDALETIIGRRTQTRFLLEDEVDFVRQFCIKKKGGPCRLH